MQGDEQQIRQLVATWVEATKAGDMDTVLGLMAEDVVFLVTGQEPMMGKTAFGEAMKAQLAQGAPRFDGKSEIQEIQVLGEWAYMWTKLSVAITPPGNGPSTVRAGHTLSILKKQDEKWVMYRDANMLSPVREK